MILAVVFSICLLLSFLCLFIALKPTRQEKEIARRVISLGVPTVRERVTETTGTAHLLKERKPGTLGSFENALVRFPFSQKTARFISQADSSMSLSTLILITIASGLGSFFVSRLFLSFVPLNLALALAAASGPYGVLAFKRSKRIRAFNMGLADAIDAIARGLRAGHSMLSALEMMAQQAPEPIRKEFMEVFKQQNFGLPLREALTQLSERVPSNDLRVLVTAMLVQKDTGGNLAEILDRTVGVIRERLRIKGEIQTQTAQGRLTGWILSSLPIVMLVLINIVNPGYSHILLDDPVGRKLLYVGIGLIATGAFFIRRIINGIEV